eukprot:TRINITY_DN10917_c0_g1_i2.p1 TRINITY_DN10917_c0_g1~~TRINITY_DN10917_c0_g1_i2.p1  ORF type:complete len:1404 (+),score=330.51 TRINITY_DN10917_c0_g1_i2:59-4270(+)
MADDRTTERLIRAALRGNLEVLKAELASEPLSKQDLNEKLFRGESLLHHACRVSLNQDVLRFLICEKGINVDLKCNNDTALSAAARRSALGKTDKERTEAKAICRFLITECGAQLLPQDQTYLQDLLVDIRRASKPLEKAIPAKTEPTAPVLPPQQEAGQKASTTEQTVLEFNQPKEEKRSQEYSGEAASTEEDNQSESSSYGYTHTMTTVTPKKLAPRIEETTAEEGPPTYREGLTPMHPEPANVLTVSDLAAQAEIVQLRAQLYRESDAHKETAVECGRLKAEIRQLQMRSRALEQQLEQVADLKATIEGLELERRQASANAKPIEELSQLLASCEEARQIAEARAEELEAQVRELKEEFHLATERAKIKAQKEAASNNTADLGKKEIDRLQQALTETESLVELTAQQRDELDHKVAELTYDVGMWKARVEELERELNTRNADADAVHELRRRLQDMETRNTDLEKLVDQMPALERRIQELQAEVDHMSERLMHHEELAVETTVLGNVNRALHREMLKGGSPYLEELQTLRAAVMMAEEDKRQLESLLAAARRGELIAIESHEIATQCDAPVELNLVPVSQESAKPNALEPELQRISEQLQEEGRRCKKLDEQLKELQERHDSLVEQLSLATQDKDIARDEAQVRRNEALSAKQEAAQLAAELVHLEDQLAQARTAAAKGSASAPPVASTPQKQATPRQAQPSEKEVALTNQVASLTAEILALKEESQKESAAAESTAKKCKELEARVAELQVLLDEAVDKAAQTEAVLSQLRIELTAAKDDSQRKALEQISFVRESERAERAEKLAQQIPSLEKLLAEKTEEGKRWQAEHSTLLSAVAALERELALRKDELQDAQARLLTLEGKASEIETRRPEPPEPQVHNLLAEMEQSRDAARVEAQELQHSLQRARADLELATQLLNEREKEISETTEKLRAVQTNANRSAALEEEIKAARSALQTAAKRESELNLAKHQAETALASTQQLLAETQRASSEYKQRASSMAQLEKSLAEAQTRVNSEQLAATAARNELASLQQLVSSLERSRLGDKKQIEDLHLALAATTTAKDRTLSEQEKLRAEIISLANERDEAVLSALHLSETLAQRVKKGEEVERVLRRDLERAQMELQQLELKHNAELSSLRGQLQRVEEAAGIAHVKIGTPEPYRALRDIQEPRQPLQNRGAEDVRRAQTPPPSSRASAVPERDPASFLPLVDTDRGAAVGRPPSARRRISGTELGPLPAFYVNLCLDALLLPNQTFLRSLPNDFSELVEIDLSNNYVGRRGIPCISDLLARCPNVQKVDLSDNKLDNESIIHFAQRAMTHPSLKHVNFSNNLCSKSSGRAILQMVLANPRIVRVDLDDLPFLVAPLKERIAEAVAANRAAKGMPVYHCASSASVAADCRV